MPMPSTWVTRALTWTTPTAFMIAAALLAMMASGTAFGLLQHGEIVAQAGETASPSTAPLPDLDGPLARHCRRLEASHLTPRDNSGQIILPFVCGPYQ